MVGSLAQILGVKVVKPRATQAERFSRSRGGDLTATETGEHLADQRSTKATGKLAIVFFMARTVPDATNIVNNLEAGSPPGPLP
jgi:hypothetical protein